MIGYFLLVICKIYVSHSPTCSAAGVGVNGVLYLVLIVLVSGVVRRVLYLVRVVLVSGIVGGVLVTSPA